MLLAYSPQGEREAYVIAFIIPMYKRWSVETNVFLSE